MSLVSLIQSYGTVSIQLCGSDVCDDRVSAFDIWFQLQLLDLEGVGNESSNQIPSTHVGGLCCGSSWFLCLGASWSDCRHLVSESPDKSSL